MDVDRQRYRCRQWLLHRAATTAQSIYTLSCDEILIQKSQERKRQCRVNSVCQRQKVGPPMTCALTSGPISGSRPSDSVSQDSHNWIVQDKLRNDQRSDAPMQPHLRATVSRWTGVDPTQALPHCKEPVPASLADLFNRRHMDVDTLQAASNDLINFYTSFELPPPRKWKS